MKRLQRALIFLPALIFCWGAFGPFPALSEGPGNPVRSAPAAASDDRDEGIRRSLSRIVPAGWQLAQPAKVFHQQNLWEQINGRADFFLAYDMVRMIFAVYSNSARDGSFIHVSLYDMGNPTNAFGVFSAERQDDIEPADFGRQAYRFGASLFVWKGPYYFRMIASRDGPGMLETNRRLAERLMVLIPDSGGPVQGLEMLPEKDRVPLSEQYFRKDAMGLDFMKDTFMARYRKRGVQVTFFVTDRGVPEAAGDTLRKYAAYAKEFGEGAQEVTRQGMLITLCDMDGTYDAIFQKHSSVAGVVSLDDRETAVDLAVEFLRQLEAGSPNSKDFK